MKIISIVLITAFVITGCGEGDTRSQNATPLNQPRSLKAMIRSADQPVLGVSTNSYGVWDDVEQYIESRFKDPAKAKAMRQLALAIQNALLQNDTPEKAQEANRVRLRAHECVTQHLGEATYYESKLLTAEMLNNELRSRAYATLDSNSGGFYKQPKGDVCDK
jgi:PBP1b-binding outer membrane lipoprotein LpoB